MPEPLTLEDVEAEYMRRHSWWEWAPTRERAAFLYAALHHDRATIKRLTTLGKRREHLREWRSCYQPDNDRCECVVRAIEAPALWRKARTEGGRVLVSYVAQQLHADSGFNVKAYLAAKEREAELRNSLPLHSELEALDPSRTKSASPSGALKSRASSARPSTSIASRTMSSARFC
jgi:hypothetical protein